MDLLLRNLIISEKMIKNFKISEERFFFPPGVVEKDGGL
jgi:hypothetical protein